MEQTVLITGCSSGIGRATANAFAEEDWRVWATARDEADVADLAAEGCRTAELDVRDEDAAGAVVDRVIDEDGRLDCLVNNAGYGQFGPLEHVPTDRLHAQFDVNVYGPHRLVRAALPHMRERGDGTIVNVSSVSGRIATPGNGPYCASKFALESLSDSLRAEVAPFDVDVVLVEPGPVDTAFKDRVAEELDAVPDAPGYEWLTRVYDDLDVVGAEDLVSVPARDVALTIRDAACAANPDPRYAVGRFARYALLARYLPDRWRDWPYRLVRMLP